VINSYWLGYAIGYYNNRVRPRLSVQYWRGYLAGMLGRLK
jgi:hypothetical protein